MSDFKFELTPQQITAVSIVNLSVNQLNAAAFECSQAHVDIAECVEALKYAATKLEDAKRAWLADTQKRIQPAIPDKKLVLVTH